MPGPVTADDLDQWAALVALGAVDAQDEPTIDRLRSQHPDFDRRVADYSEVAAALAASVEADAPTELRDSVLAAVRSRARGSNDVAPLLRRRSGSRSAKPVTGPGRRRRVANSGVLLAAAGVAAAVLGGGGLWAAGFFGPDATDIRATTTQSSQPEEPAASETTLDVPAGGQFSLAHAPGSDEATVRLINVPAPPEGHAYQMWMMREGQASSAGVMEAGDVHPETRAVLAGMSGVTRFMVTVEPTGGSTTPTGQPVVDVPV
ncbi:hypothetical protein DLJ54_05890 [Corynebacterium heidelbergense]|uniref:Regulator of SigK n=1 Tax=Corynebacterium heidelbergense TaxID=2055947 RepID=A0A364V5M6_9CORY|nr:hypothetical protein DLJ54_05890 [Corynebacterium heidelbergense]